MSAANVTFQDIFGDPCDPADVERFSFQCPKLKGQTCSALLIRGAKNAPTERPSWVWDGDVEAPTFSPSVNHENCPGGGWHGFIELGRCVSTAKADEPEPSR